MSSESSSTARSRSLKHTISTDHHLCTETYSPLVVLEQLLLVAGLEVVSHGICPLECHTTFEDLVDGLLHELHLDPGKIRGHLHLLHLPLGLGVQLDGELRRLFVVGPTVVVLGRRQRCGLSGNSGARTWR